MWHEGSWLDSFDKKVSNPVFKLQLPAWSEGLLSVPGALLAFPQAFLGPTPLSIAWLVHAAHGLPAPRALIASVVVSWVVGSVAFYGGLLGRFSARTATKATVVGMIIYTALVLTRVGMIAPAKAAACWSLCSVMLTVAACIPLKAIFHRTRPAVALGLVEHVEQRRSAVLHTYIKEMCAGGQKFDSLPSADVAIAGANAVIVWSVGYPSLACFLVVGSAFGRIYMWAHHLIDVAAGGALGVGVAKLISTLGIGSSLQHVAVAYATFFLTLLYLAARMRTVSSASEKKTASGSEHAA